MSPNFTAGLVARSLLVLLFCVVFVVAVFIAGASLHDPDTCWLMALGRLIVETGKLPAQDPFSFTMGMFPEKKFVLYQWLTEVLFFLSYKAGDLVGLLMLTALVLSASFISIPLALARKIGAPGVFSVVGTILLVLSAFFHFLARPEIFSYLLLSIYVACSHFFLRNRQLSRIDWIAVTVYGGLMILWCNLHSGFALGLIFLTVFTLVTSAATFLKERQLNALNKTAIASTVAAFLATFVNPYGVGLWDYLPKLFFSPVNHRIDELRPLKVADFFEVTYYPFFILAGLCICAAVRALRAKIDGEGEPRGQVLFAAVSIIGWSIAGFFCRRLIPFAAIQIMAEGCFLLSLLKKEGPGFWNSVNERLDGAYSPRGFMWFLTIAVFSGLGVYFVTSRIAPPTLPQSSQSVQPPFQAIEYLKKNPLEGNLFNGPHFGDAMIWHMQPAPKVFIDTRFDMYGAEIVNAYEVAYNCREKWEEVLREYKIQSIFLRPDSELVKRLRTNSEWMVVYEDKDAVVLAKKGQ